jgi:HSP20 family protein
MVHITRIRSPFTNFLDTVDEFFTESWGPTTITNIKNRGIPATNIKQNDDGFLVELAAPGVSKDNFDIKLEDDRLIVNYQETDSDEDEVDNYTKREFVYSAFTKTIIIPENVDRDKINGKYENGILQLNIPWDKAKLETKIKSIKIE